MEGQGPNKYPGQAQMRREWDDTQNQQSDSQSTNFLQETGSSVKNIAQGAADVGKGAAQGAVSLAKGAALGAANIAQGAADAVKNTLGMNQPADHNNNNNMINTTGGHHSTAAAAMNFPGSTTNMGGASGASNADIDLEGLTYPSTTTHNPSNPNTRI
ncbi:hypothetical protein ACP275_04G106200 [Erythranthe tilingii]